MENQISRKEHYCQQEAFRVELRYTASSVINESRLAGLMMLQRCFKNWHKSNKSSVYKPNTFGCLVSWGVNRVWKTQGIDVLSNLSANAFREKCENHESYYFFLFFHLFLWVLILYKFKQELSYLSRISAGTQ